MELWRRVILVMGILSAVILFFWVSLKPLFTVEAVDFADEQKNLSLWTEQNQYLAQLPLNEYIAEITRDKTIPVEGREWEAFFTGVMAVSDNEPGAPEEWLRRIPASQKDWEFTTRELFFKRNDSPLDEISSHFRFDQDRKYLVLLVDDKPQYLEATCHIYSHDDFLFGSGLTSTKPPAFLFNPLRRFSLWVLLAALALYIFLPTVKHEKDAVFYPRWRLVLGDFVSILLTVPFFSLPILLSGGTLQSFTNAFFLIPIFWFLGGLGLYLVWVTSWYGEFSLVVRPDRLDLTTIDGGETIFYDAISSTRALVARPPRWLIVLSWLAALAGRGSARYGGIGRAMILSGTAYHGLCLNLKDGSSRYLWITDQLGTKALKRAENIPQSLQAAGVKIERRPMEIESLGMKYGENIKKVPGRLKRKRAFILVWSIPAIVLAAAAWMQYLTGPAPEVLGGGVSNLVEHTAGPMAWEAPITGPEWEETYSGGMGGGISIGRAFVAMPDGEFFLAGHTNDFKTGMGSDTDLYVVKTDGTGVPEWQKAFGTDLPDTLQSICPTGYGGLLLVGETEPQAASIIGGSSDVYLVKLDASGQKEWDLTFGESGTFEHAFSARLTAEGGFEIPLSNDRSGLSILHLDADGKVVAEIPVSTEFPGTEPNLLWIAPTKDGGFIATGDVLNEGVGFKEFLLIRFSGRGEQDWAVTFGGKRKESGNFVIQTKDAGFVAVGVTESLGQGADDLYLVKTDSNGILQWERAFGSSGEEEGAFLAQTSDGGFIAVGASMQEGQSGSLIYLVKTDDRGNLEWEKFVRGEGTEYFPSTVHETADGGFVVCGTRTLGDYSITLFLLKIY